MTSLRARKKRATAHALADAAYALAVDHGLESVTTDDIATEAGFSRRTFANYYVNKYEAVVDGFVQHLGIPLWRPDDPVDAHDLPETFTALVEASKAFFSDVFTDSSRIGHIQDFAVMVKNNPALEPYIHTVFLEFQNSSSHKILADRFGDPKVSIFIGAVIGSLSGIIRMILGPIAFPTPDSDPASAPPILREEEIREILNHIDLTFTYLRHGFVDHEKETSCTN